MPLVGMQSVIVTFPGHTHLLLNYEILVISYECRNKSGVTCIYNYYFLTML